MTTTNFNEASVLINKRQYATMFPNEQVPEDTLWRVSRFIGNGDEERTQRYGKLMTEKKFCPGGRFLAGAGTEHGNILNCFVQASTDHPPGTQEGINEIQVKLALVTKVGGGNGTNLDVHQPRTAQADQNRRIYGLLEYKHKDVITFIEGNMTDNNGNENQITLRYVDKIIYYPENEEGNISDDLRARAKKHGVRIVEKNALGLLFEKPIKAFTVPDDLRGIVTTAQDMIKFLQQNDDHEITVDFSQMRPEHAPIRGSGGSSSGPFSFLYEVYDQSMTWLNRGGVAGGPVNTLRYAYAPILRVTKQGGTRRGAGMATLNIDHADILDFITCKDNDREAIEGDIATFNISILITKEFWEAKEKNALWIVPQNVPSKYIQKEYGEFQGTWTEHETDPETGNIIIPVFTDAQGQKGVPALWFWDEIAQHAWMTGEPGLMFITRINDHSALKNLGEKYQIRSTNPCLRGDMEVIVRFENSAIEIMNVKDLASAGEVQVWSGEAWQNTTFRETGKNRELIEIHLSYGEPLVVTPNHQMILQGGERINASELQSGMILQQGMSGSNIMQAIEKHAINTPTTKVNNLERAPHTYTVTGVSQTNPSDTYCCTVPENHAFTLKNGVLVGNCGEIPLSAGEPCDLGAINLGRYVDEDKEMPFPTFKEEEFRQDIHIAVDFLDRALDLNVFTIEQNREASQDLRRLGLGVMGLADMLIRMGYAYDSEEGREFTYKVMNILREEAQRASEELALINEPYPVYARNNTYKLGNNAVHSGPIPHAPRRNVAVLTVAPTGTTSMMMEASSGIEPIYSPFLYRKVGTEYLTLIHPLLQEFLERWPAPEEVRTEKGAWDWTKMIEVLNEADGTLENVKFIPDEIKRVFRFAHDIHPLEHVRMQGVIQRAFDAEGYIGNSISKTINLKNNATKDEIKDAYEEAYLTGCKGITVYRDGSRTYQPLNTSKKKASTQVMGESSEETAEQDIQNEPKPNEEVNQAPSDLHDMSREDLLKLIEEQNRTIANLKHDQFILEGSEPAPITIETAKFKREPVLKGQTIQVKLHSTETEKQTSYLVVVNVDEATGLPIEVILVGGSSGQEAHADGEALGRLTSKSLQAGVPVGTIVRTLEGIEGGLNGYARMSNDLTSKPYRISSKAQLIAATLRHVINTKNKMKNSSVPNIQGASHCPNCHEKGLILEEGCKRCLICDYQKCL